MTMTDTTRTNRAAVERRIEFARRPHVRMPENHPTMRLYHDYLAALDVLEWYADADNYDDSDCPNYGIPGEGKQINHPFDPDEWDWVADNGTRARAFLASTEGEQP